jgi:hypothetical protein
LVFFTARELEHQRPVTVEADLEVIKTHPGLTVFTVTPDHEAGLAQGAIGLRKH